MTTVNYVPCLNPARCGVQKHRAGGAAHSECVRLNSSAGEGRQKSPAAPPLPMGATSPVRDNKDAPFTERVDVLAALLRSNDGLPEEGVSEEADKYAGSYYQDDAEFLLGQIDSNDGAEYQEHLLNLTSDMAHRQAERGEVEDPEGLSWGQVSYVQSIVETALDYAGVKEDEED